MNRGKLKKGPFIKDVRTAGGGKEVPEKQKNADMGEGGILPIRTSFLRCLIWCFLGLDSSQFGQYPNSTFSNILQEVG